jgi:hypothetical protein
MDNRSLISLISMAGFYCDEQFMISYQYLKLITGHKTRRFQPYATYR